MNAAQIHLALNHAPLFLSAIGAVVLFFGMIKKNDSFKTLALYFLLGGAIFTIPVFLTGEGTEELVEHLPGVNENAIEEHEEMAKISLAIIAVSGVAALAGLFVRRNAMIRRWVYTICLLLSLGSFGTMAQTAHLGGLIRHGEIQNGKSPATDKEEPGYDNKDDD